MRFRHVYMALGSILVIILGLLSDPDTGLIQNMPFGASILASLIILSKAVLYVALLHLSRKALMDYIDLEVYAKEAIKTPEGSAQLTIAVSIYTLAAALVIYAATV
jgi:hypothetical protein